MYFVPLSDFLKVQHFLPDWFKQGIHLIGDISNTDDGLLELEDINSTHCKETPLCEYIRNEFLLSKYPDIELTDKWSIIYKIYFESIEDNNLKWFQYPILYKILRTKEYLKKTNL